MPRHRPRPRTLLPLATLCAALGGLSNPLLADDAVNDSARQFLEQRLLEQGLQGSVEIATSSARMPACSEPQPFLPRSGQRLLGRVAVGVRCADGQTRYLQAQIGVVGDYVVAARAIAAGVKAVVFDRGAYLYHGRVKALADAAREGGLTF